MLDAFIIEELRRREELERDHRERPTLELPLDYDRERRPTQRSEEEKKETPQRGVIVIDF